MKGKRKDKRLCSAQIHQHHTDWSTTSSLIIECDYNAGKTTMKAFPLVEENEWV
ncbi:hypothetical protein D3C74_00780 [compost metagenome]